MIDYHTHSTNSDGVASYYEMIKSAIDKGVTELGFSDHLCLYYPKWSMKKESFAKVIQEIIQIKKNVNDIDIKFGLEVDYLEGWEIEIQKSIDLFPVDYIIGSVHYIGDWNFDTVTEKYVSIHIDQFFRDYFRLIQKAATSGLFDIMGHIDIPKKFNYSPSFDLEPYYTETAQIFSKSNVVVELNTSGLDLPCQEFYPSDNFLKQCYVQHVPITLGSDAHTPDDIARYFPQAISKLKSIGYRKIATFKNRTRILINL